MSWKNTVQVWINVKNYNSILHTYINLQSFSPDYDLASHTTYIVWVNFIHKRRDLQFKVDSKRQIFEKLFMAILFTLRISVRNLLKGSIRRNIFFVFRFIREACAGFQD